MVTLAFQEKPLHTSAACGLPFTGLIRIQWRNSGLSGRIAFRNHAVRLFSLLLALFLLAACDQSQLLQKFASIDEQAQAKSYVDHLRARDFDYVERAADSSIRSPALRETLTKMAGMIPNDEPVSVKLVGAHSFRGADVRTLNTTFEYDYGNKWLLANVVTQEKGGIKTIVGFNVYPRSNSLEVENRFTLAGKARIQYLVLTGAIAAILVTIYSLVKCARTKLPGRKWPWVLFILVGFGKFDVNWTTGEWGFAPLSVQLLSAAALAPLYGPLTVAVSVPLGAILFLVFRRKARHAAPT